MGSNFDSDSVNEKYVTPEPMNIVIVCFDVRNNVLSFES